MVVMLSSETISKRKHLLYAKYSSLVRNRISRQPEKMSKHVFGAVSELVTPRRIQVARDADGRKHLATCFAQPGKISTKWFGQDKRKDHRRAKTRFYHPTWSQNGVILGVNLRYICSREP